MSDKYVLDQTDDRRTDMHFNDIADTITFNTVQDAEPIIEANKRKYNEFGDKMSLGKRGEWHHAASIPKTILEQWVKETNGAVLKDPKLLAAYLNNPDWKLLKVAPTNL